MVVPRAHTSGATSPEQEEERQKNAAADYDHVQLGKELDAELRALQERKKRHQEKANRRHAAAAAAAAAASGGSVVPTGRSSRRPNPSSGPSRQSSNSDTPTSPVRPGASRSSSFFGIGTLSSAPSTPSSPVTERATTKDAHADRDNEDDAQAAQRPSSTPATSSSQANSSPPEREATSSSILSPSTPQESTVLSRRGHHFHLPKIKALDFGHAFHAQQQPQSGSILLSPSDTKKADGSAATVTSSARGGAGAAGNKSKGGGASSSTAIADTPLSMTRTISFREPRERIDGQLSATSTAAIPESSSAWIEDFRNQRGSFAPDATTPTPMRTTGFRSGYGSRGGGFRQRSWSNASDGWSSAGDTTDYDYDDDADTASTASSDDDDRSRTAGLGRFVFRSGLLDRLREKRRRALEDDARNVLEREEFRMAAGGDGVADHENQQNSASAAGAAGKTSVAPALEEGEVRLYRKTPILSGVVAPFSIMLEVPGLTEQWYVRSPQPGLGVVFQNNPVILDVGLAISMACGVLANIAIILRFVEFLRPQKSTIFATLCLIIHDSINLVAISIFGKIHAVDDGYTYNQPFYLTIGSTLASMIVTVSLIADYVNTKNFRNAGSGLTQKQKELVIMSMAFLFYLSIGSLIFALSLKISFVDALYFSLCTITTVGFGDISPTNIGSRIFLFIFAPTGIVLVALVIATARQTILEYFEKAYKQRRSKFRQRYEEKQRARRELREERRALEAVSLQRRGLLRSGAAGARRAGTGVWKAVRKNTVRSLSMFSAQSPTRIKQRGTSSKKSVDLQSKDEKIDSPASEDVKGDGSLLLPVMSNPSTIEGSDPSTKVASTVDPAEQKEKEILRSESPEPMTPATIPKELNADETGLGGASAADEKAGAQDTAEQEPESEADADSEAEIEQMERELQRQREALEDDWKTYKRKVAASERNEFVAKLIVSFTIFVFFWMIGSLVFTFTENIDFFTSFYFCFVFFSTIGYGDVTPKSPAGRGFFICWALFGIGILTVVISVVSDAWESTYKKTLAKAAKRDRKGARKRTKMMAALTRTNSRYSVSSRTPSSAFATSATVIEDFEGSNAPTLEASDGVLDADLSQRSGADAAEGAAVTPQPALNARQLEELPMEFARVGMTLHDQAQHFFFAQRDSIHTALVNLPGLEDFLPEKRAQYSEQQLHAVMRIANDSGDPVSIQAAEHLLSMHKMEEQLATVVKHANVLRDHIIRQREEIVELKKLKDEVNDDEEDGARSPSRKDEAEEPQSEEKDSSSESKIATPSLTG